MLVHVEGGTIRHCGQREITSRLGTLPYDCESLEIIPPLPLLVVSNSLELITAVHCCAGTIGGGF